MVMSTNPLGAPAARTSKVFVGLDLGKRKAQACVLAADGSVQGRYELPVAREALERFAREVLPADSHVAVETSTNGYAVCNLLIQAGHAVTMSNPILTKLIAASKVKTDKVDAKVLAQLLRAEFLPGVWIADAATHELRTLCAHRASLVKTRTVYKNRVHSILARNLIEPPQVSDLFGKKGRAWLDGLVQAPGEGSKGDTRLAPHERLQVQSCLNLIDATQKEIEAVEAQMSRRGLQEPWAGLLKRVVTITGIDSLGGLTLPAAIGPAPSGIERFASPKKLAGYFGLVPSVYQSGQSEYHGHITKRGNRLARWVLVQSAQAAVRADPGMKAFYKRIKSRKGHNVAVVAVARKLAVLLWYVLTEETTFSRQRPLLVQNKLAKLRLKGTGQKLKTGPKPKGQAQGQGTSPSGNGPQSERPAAAVGGSNRRKARQARGRIDAKPLPAKPTGDYEVSVA